MTDAFLEYTIGPDDPDYMEDVNDVVAYVQENVRLYIVLHMLHCTCSQECMRAEGMCSPDTVELICDNWICLE